MKNGGYIFLLIITSVSNWVYVGNEMQISVDSDIQNLHDDTMILFWPLLIACMLPCFAVMRMQLKEQYVHV